MGNVSTPTLYGGTGACPTENNFYSGPTEAMTCYSATITCSHTANLDITFGYAPPVGSNKGTIVLLSGDGGTSASTNPENMYADAYVNAGYGVVEVAYFTDWENGNPTNYAINDERNAACRPATFLNFVRYNTGLVGGTHLYTSGGMCAQGISGGSSEIAYSLVYYNAASYLDKVEMEVGPPMGNIEAGCQLPKPDTPKTLCPDTETGCQGWNGGLVNPPYTPYTGGTGQANMSFVTSTYMDPNHANTYTCRDPYGTHPSGATWEQTWDQQSIAPQTTTPTGGYSYPSTSIQAWLCASTTSGGAETLNNSGILGNYFYSAITASKKLNVTAVTLCSGAEGVDAGTISSAGTGNLKSPYYGKVALAAIEQDMADYPLGSLSLTFDCSNYH